MLEKIVLCLMASTIVTEASMGMGRYNELAEKSSVEMERCNELANVEDNYKALMDKTVQQGSVPESDFEAFSALVIEKKVSLSALCSMFDFLMSDVPTWEQSSDLLNDLHDRLLEAVLLKSVKNSSQS